MKTIFKYELPINDTAYVPMPAGAKILSAQVQNERPCIWAEVDSDAAIEMRLIIVHGTGHPVLQHGEFIGTIQIDGGRLVFHIFEGSS